MNKRIENWRIIKVHGGGVCLVGEVDGKHTQTTNVIAANTGHLKTETGSIYALGKKDPGVWEIQLQIDRPKEFANLQKNGIL